MLTWPVVGLLIVTTVREWIAMDLKKFRSVHLLHLIDQATRLSACVVMCSKRPEVIIEKYFAYESLFMVAQKIP